MRAAAATNDSFLADAAAFQGGVRVAVGDVTADGLADVVTGAAEGRGEVRVFRGADTAQAGAFLAGPEGYGGGARVATGDVNADGRLDVLAAAGPGAGWVRAFDAAMFSEVSSAKPLGPAFDGGLFVAADAPAAPTLHPLTVLPEVSVAALQATVNEPASFFPQNQFTFRFTRTGDTSASLTAYYALSGSATAFTDYSYTLMSPITFAAGQATKDVDMYASYDTRFEGPETVVVTVSSNAAYTVGAAGTAVTTILDRDGPAPVVPQDEACGAGTPVAEAGGVTAAGPSGADAGARPFDGAATWSGSDLSSGGFGSWGQGLSWSSDPGLNAPAQNGSGMVASFLPALKKDSAGTVVLSTSGTSARYFDAVSGGFQERHFLQDSLSYNSTTGRYTFRDTAGNTAVYYDFGSGVAAAKRGTLDTITDAAGNQTAVTAWNSSGVPQEVQRSSTVGGTTVTESYVYAFLSSGTNAGKVSSVTLRRQVGGGSWATVRSVEYGYYDGAEANGPLGSLKRSDEKDASGNVVDRRYFRWYVSGEASGYAGGLKYQFGGASYGRLAAAYGDPTAATDSQVAAYADVYYEYDAARRVSKKVAQGEGCSACTGGLGTATFTSALSPFADGYNTWRSKQVTANPDGSTRAVYVNFAGETLLDVTNVGGSEWATFYKYDPSGRLVLRAEPSAVSGYDETRPDLLNNQGGNYQYLRDSAGLVETTTYGTSTTATSTTAGDVAGYVKQTAVQRGEAGTSVPQSLTQYISRTAGSQTVYVTAAQTRYRNDDGTGGQTTTTSYAWLSGTVQPSSVTVTLPAVTTAQNGPNGATSTTDVMDAYGRVVWSKDAGGFLRYTQYDQATGGVVKTIADVDTAQASTFSGLPSGWTTPAGGGLHLTATMEVDDQGRTTKETDPAGRVTYTVYNDANHEVRVYRGWEATTNLPTGPTEVTRTDRAGSYTETLTMSATPAVSGGRPTGAESIGSVQSLSRSYTNSAGQVTQSDAYFDLSGLTYSASTTLGTENTNFYRTRYGYDWRGRESMTKTPTGTISRTVYDGLGRPVSQWVGTDDTGWTQTDPSNGGASPNDMVKVSESQYDGGGVGDGDLTQTTAYPGGSAAARVSQTYYDWRDRPVASKSGVQSTEGTTVQRPISYTQFDNLGEAVASESYDGDNVTVSDANSDGVPDRPSSSLLRAKSTASCDELGRAYRSETFGVDPSTGGVSTNSLKTDTWFDARGNAIKTASPGGLVSKSVIDGAGRTAKSYTTDGGGDSGYSDASTVTGDAVLEQTEYGYDAAGGVILVTTRQRFHDETGTGELGTPSSGVKARVSYAASYYDKAGRATDSVDVGTNGGSAYARPSSAPSRSDTFLVTSQSYDAAGRVDTTTDPRGLVARQYYDALGRTTKTVENYVDGTVSDADDKTTEYTYDGSGNRLTLTARLTGGAYQTTQWVYGVSGSTGSDVASNDVLRAVRYPDPSTGAASSSEQETATVNALGEVKASTDRNGTTHTFTRDVLGRTTADAVTTLGSGVDGAVRRIETAYDSAGMAYLFTSYDAASGGSVVNQVQRQFNGLGQMTREYQAVSGSVNTSTTPHVGYSYSEMSGGANHSRLTGMTYPNGKALTYNYASSLDSSVSRLSSLSDSTGTLESYSYLGLGTVVERKHGQPGVDLSYVKRTGESDGDGGDRYAGLDRFGRVVDQRWLNPSTGTATDRFKYGYDRGGNRLHRENVLDALFSELYHADGAAAGYDGLNQLTEFQRGTLSDANSDGVYDTVSTASRSQAWDLDALGNFDSQTTDGTAQTRTHNAQNEITAVSGLTAPTFSANGEMTGDEQGRSLKYDAWGRLVEVKQGTTVLSSYSHDALSRRVQEGARALYYSASWQVVEERASGVVVAQAVFSPVYVDALVLRDRDTDGNGTLDERLWVQQDANWDVTALVNGSGGVVERYAYDPYGTPTVLTGSFGSRSSSLYAWVYLHQGGRYDAAAGLYHFRNRDLSPTLGRWTRNDPLGFAAGDVSRYRYEANRPTVLLDQSGLIGVFYLGAGQRPNQAGSSLIERLRNNYRGLSLLFTTPDATPFTWQPDAWVSRTFDFIVAHVEAAKQNCRTERVDLFGYSRGAVAVASLAGLLNNVNIRVDFLGIVDPVLTRVDPFPAALHIPGNVRFAVAALKTPRAEDVTLPFDGLLNTAPIVVDSRSNTSYAQADFALRHVPMSVDRAGTVQEWITGNARLAGVPI